MTMLILLIVSVIFYTGCSPEPQERDDDQLPPGEEYDEIIDVKVGDEFTISRGSNPSTGYEWKLEFDSALIKLEKKSFLPDKNIPGSPGTDTYTFTALKASKAKIKMIYWREWEKVVIEEYLVLVRIT